MPCWTQNWETYQIHMIAIHLNCRQSNGCSVVQEDIHKTGKPNEFIWLQYSLTTDRAMGAVWSNKITIKSKEAVLIEVVIPEQTRIKRPTETGSAIWRHGRVKMLFRNIKPMLQTDSKLLTGWHVCISLLYVEADTNILDKHSSTASS